MFENITWDFSGMEIERESFRRIEAEADRSKWNDKEWPVARRLIHTTADFTIADTLKLRHNPVDAGVAALYQGVPLYSDSNMIRSGISVPKLQKFNPDYTRESITCLVADPEVAATAKEQNITRALAAVRKARAIIDDGIFLCGNAPLALAGVIKMIIEEGIRPALIIGMPVGFVNVVESKELLREVDIPHITIEGRRGGSPLAVATLHAVMESEL
ncbi:precorrin-8X methylmutase [Lentisphaerota bacterium ZTH]|nr:precorrin-8X methylmutase [Lentisphaerota bacterium]WET07546.1 precorrin-8X methylmutase [Lentisphaerota bacterium ZTH]